MYARILLSALLLVIAPAANADGGNGQGHGQGNGQDHGAGDGHGHGPGDGGHGSDGNATHGHPPSDNATTESIDLSGQTQNGAAMLNWVFHGHADHVSSFDVLKSVNGGAEQLVGTVGADERSYTDPQSSSSSAATTYSVVAHHVDGSSSTKSNNAILLFGCNWVSIYPGGNPPVLLHPECL